MFFPNNYSNIKKEIKDGCKHKLIELYGWTGSVSVITAYGLTTINYDKKIFIDICNLYGSLSIGIICYRAKVWQAMILEIGWFGIGIYSLINNIYENSE